LTDAITQQSAGSPRATGRSRNRHAFAARASDHFFAAVPALWLFVFFIAPLAFTVVFSFGHATFGSVVLGFTLDNYRKALSGFYFATFLRTIRFALNACALCLIAAFPTAYFIARHAGRFKTAAFVVVLVPYFTSFLIRVMSWQILLARGGARLVGGSSSSASLTKCVLPSPPGSGQTKAGWKPSENGIGASPAFRTSARLTSVPPSRAKTMSGRRQRDRTSASLPSRPYEDGGSRSLLRPR
jgi:hypothetical protein